MFFLFAEPVSAVDYYVDGAGGSNGNGGTSWADAFESIGKGISVMIGGDTLIIADGTYDATYKPDGTHDNLIDGNIPSGTSNQYTTIKAQNDYRVIIDGSNLAGSGSGTVRMSGLEYVQLIGIGSANTPASAMSIEGSHHIKVMNCSVQDAAGAAVVLGRYTNYSLVEGCFAWGNSRYTYQVTGGSAGCHPIESEPDFPTDRRFNCSHFNVFRGNVARWDYGTVNEPGGSYSNYLQNHAYFFNNVAIDGTGMQYNDWVAGGLLTIHSAPIALLTASGHDNTEFRGNIVLNYNGAGWVLSGTSPELSRNIKFEDNVLWDLSTSPTGDLAGYDLYLGRSLYVPNSELGPDSHTYNHNTFGNIDNYEGHYIDGYEDVYGEKALSKNSIYYNISLINPGESAHKAMKSDYNVFWGNTLDYRLTGGAIDQSEVLANDMSDYWGNAVDPISAFNSILKVSDSGGILDPADDGVRERGAHIEYLIGKPGTLYGEEGWNEIQYDNPLFPWANEDIMAEQMCAFSKTEGEELESNWFSCSVDVNTDIFTCPGISLVHRDKVSFTGITLPQGVPNGPLENMPFHAFCVNGDSFMLTGLPAIPNEGDPANGELDCVNQIFPAGWVLGDDYVDVTSSGSSFSVAKGWNNPDMNGNRGFCLSTSFSDYILNYVEGQDLLTCSELGGTTCGGSQGCDGTSVPSSDGQCCLGTCRDCVLSDTYWADGSGVNISGQTIEEGDTIYQKAITSFCGGKTLNVTIFEDDISWFGEDSFDDYITEFLISIPSSAYDINQAWLSQWTSDGPFNDPEYYFKTTLVDDESVNIKSGEIHVVQDSTAPIIGNVQASNVGATSAIIIWNTDENSDSTVFYGLDQADLSLSESLLDSVISHSVSLSNLNSEITYYYKVESCDSRGNCAESPVDSFVTGNVADVTLDFSFLEDTKISVSGPNNNWGSKTSLNINDDSYHVLMRWNLLDYQGQNLDSAILRVYNFDVNSLGQLVTLSVYPFLNNLWTEGTGSGVLATDGATWNEWDFTSEVSPVNIWNGYPNGPNELDYGLANVANPQAVKTDVDYMEFDITNLVQQLLDGTYAYDNGFIIKSDTYLNTRSSESSNNPPELVLNFVGGVPDCQLDIDCDDSLSCTLDVCNAGTCENNLDANSCLINSACYADGVSNPQQTCAVCNVAYNQYSWDTSGCVGGTDLIYLDSGQWTFHQDVSSNGNTIFTGMPNGIQSWDVSNVDIPNFLDDYYFDGENPYSVDEQSNVLGVTTVGGELYLFDVSNPSSILFSGITSGLGANPFVRLYDDGNLWAYTAGDSSLDFKIWDLSNTALPSLRGSVGLNKGKSLVLSGTNAFVVTNDGLSSIDISNADSPSLSNSLALTGVLERISIGQNRVYVSARTTGIHIVDISTPSILSLVNTFIPNVGDGNGNLEVKDVFVSGSNLYVITDLTGLIVYDISNPDNPVLLGYDIGSWSDFDWMDVNNNYAYVAHWDGTNPGILIHDVSVPSTPNYVSRTEGYDYVRFVDSDGGYVYGATGGQGVFVHDHNDLNNLVEMGNLPIFESWGVKAVGNLVYIASTTRGLVVGDFSNPSIPSELGSVSVGQARAVDVVGSVAYVGAFSQGLASIDVGDSNNPIILDQEILPSMETIALDISGSLVATADRGAGVNFWDVTNPSNILYFGNYPTTNFALDVDIYGGYAYVAEDNNGLHIVDISNPTTPIQSGFLSMGLIESFDISGSYLYVALYGGGVSVYDLSDVLNPSLVSNYNSPGGAVSVSVENDKVYVADRSSIIALQFGEEIPQEQCQLTNAYWNSNINDDIVDDNTLVTLTLEGTNCAGEQINFTIYEDDAILDDLVISQIGIYASTTWTATWTYNGDDDIGNDPRDYYFESVLVSNESISYTSVDILQVQRVVAACTDDDEDGYNITGGECGPIDCNDADSTVNPGASEACNGVDDDCDILTDDGVDETWYGQATSCGVGECIASGIYTCNGGLQTDTCVAGTPSSETCDGLDNNCDGTPDDGGDSLCDNGLFCDGVEICGDILGCQVGTPVICSDEYSCTDDSCDEAGDSCAYIEDDANCQIGEVCDGDYFGPPIGCGIYPDCLGQQDGTSCSDGVFCNGPEECRSEVCVNMGELESCDDGVSCTIDSCNIQSDSCDNLPDDNICDDGLYCVVGEYCDPQLDCQVGSLNDCSDGLACSIDSCDEINDECDYDTSACPLGFTLDLQAGIWNYITLPVNIDNNDISQLEASMVLAYDPINDVWLMNFGPFQQIANLEPLVGYIVMVSEDKSIQFSGTNLGPLVLENDMWNLAGVNESGLINDIYSGAGTLLVYEWDNNLGDLVLVDFETPLQTGIAYWIGVGDAGSPPEEEGSGFAGKLISGIARIFGYFVLDTGMPNGNLLANSFFS